MTNRLYFVYALTYNNGLPFYIGKGYGDRPKYHEQEAKRNHQCPKCNTIRSIITVGNSVGKTILYATYDENDARNAEKEFIQLYGRQNLTNRNNGGQGQSGYIPTEETRKKWAEAARRLHTGRKLPPRSEEYRRKQSIALAGKKRGPQTPETIAKRVEKLIGKKRGPMSEECKAKISAANKGRKIGPYSEERRKAISEGRKRYYERKRAAAQ